jgi:hypothetical protein
MIPKDQYRPPDLADLRLGWPAALLMIVGMAIFIAAFVAFGPI